jgi:hypothetical protein
MTEIYEKCALDYLEGWLCKERYFRDDILSLQNPNRLDALCRAAGYFRIARTLRTRFDLGVGKQRLEPVLSLLDKSRPAPTDAPGAVIPFECELSELYGNRGVLSAASKILWLWHQDPIIIYDSQARFALGTYPGDYHTYVDVWLTRWAQEEASIHAACEDLQNLYSTRSSIAEIDSKEVAAIAQQLWFQKRVLDIRLWREGS